MSYRGTLVRKLKKISRDLEEEGMDFVICVNTTPRAKVHKVMVEMVSKDDHHTLDMLHEIMRAWCKGSHQK